MFDRPIDEYKQCSRCFELKPRSSFYKHASSKSGALMSWCKSCNKAITMTWRENNKERFKELQRQASDRYAAKRGRVRAEQPHKRLFATTNDKRTFTLGIRLSHDEKEQLRGLAEQANCSMSDYIRLLIFDYFAGIPSDDPVWRELNYDAAQVAGWEAEKEAQRQEEMAIAAKAPSNGNGVPFGRGA
jgi:hypothetical protein